MVDIRNPDDHLSEPNDSTDAPQSKVPAHSNAPSYVVGVGASAGGLEALQRFFESMPAASNLAFVVIQHLSPDYKSLMVELLSKRSSMEVTRAEDGELIQGGHVYLIPPKKNLVIQNGRLSLLHQEQRHALNLPIDLFLHSLAEDYGERGISVILSGTGSDGTRGSRAIKEKGGLVIAQNEESARFHGMPSSVIDSGLADLVLTPEAMPQELLRYVNHPLVSRPATELAKYPTNEDKYQKIINQLRRESGVDFSAYKTTTLYRRIERRMGIAQVHSLDEYVAYLQSSRSETTHLFKDLLIGVTRFFRDPDAFNLLEKEVFPALVERQDRSQPLRIWVMGCATGEEAYSLAVLLWDFLHGGGHEQDFKIFATDLDKSSLEIASQGSWPENIAADIPQDILQRHFVRKGDQFTIRREIRDRVIFAQQNILKDPPFTRIDLVTCRNLLIYLKAPEQQRILSMFHFSLRPGGFLFLGSSETIGELQDCFSVVDAKWRIYRSRGGEAPPYLSNRNQSNISTGRLHSISRSEHGSLRSPEKPFFETKLVEQVEQKLINEFVPTCLMVDEDLNLLHSFGQDLPFLNLPTGRPSLHLLRMLPKDLGLAISTAAKRLRKEKTSVSFKDIKFRHSDINYRVNLRLEFFQKASHFSPCLLIFVELVKKELSSEEQSETFDLEARSRQRLVDLEQELQFTKENLQASIEEMETSNEELQAANEELIASNEELQSTNEELESVNEELYTVNSEYQSKILELTELNDDMNNLLNCSEVGIIFLDTSLQVRKFTPAVAKLMPLRNQDIGRPIREISHPVINAVLSAASRVRDGHDSIIETVACPNEVFYRMSVLPYSTSGKRSEGVVVNLVDVSDLKSAEMDADDNKIWLDRLIDTLPVGICVTDENGCFRKVNATYANLYGYAKEELEGKSFLLVVPEKDRPALERMHQNFIAGEVEMPGEFEVLHRDGRTLRVKVSATRLTSHAGSIQKVTIVQA